MRLFKKMSEHMRPDLKTYNLLLKAMHNSSGIRFGNLSPMMKKMREDGLEPDDTTYLLLVSFVGKFEFSTTLLYMMSGGPLFALHSGCVWIRPAEL